MKKEKPTKKPLNMPHTYVLLFCVIIVMAIMTYIIPAGEFERYEDPNTGRTMVDSESFHYVDRTPVTPFGVFKAIPNGMNAAARISFFIFVIAGSFQIITATGAINAGIYKMTHILSGREKLLIPIFMFLFSLTGAFWGGAEENIIFVPIAIALARALGYDALVGMSLITIGGNCGFNSAMMNPFTVGIAQGIAELPLFSGIGLRFIIWIVFLIVSIWYVMRYARKVKEDPAKSIVRNLELKEEKNPSSLNIHENIESKRSHIFVFLTLLLGFGSIIYGVYQYEWYITEISAIFLAIGIISGLISGISPNNIAAEFVNGARSIVFGGLVVGVARGILVVMQDGNILDTIIYALASVISTLPHYLSAIGMYIVQVIINFFIPSGSGQAAATMPIMVPLSDLVGLTRQTAVLAFQFGDGFTNIIIPTASTLMATLSLAKIPYEKWVKYMGKLMLLWILLGAAFMAIASIIRYGPF